MVNSLKEKQEYDKNLELPYQLQQMIDENLEQQKWWNLRKKWFFWVKVVFLMQIPTVVMKMEACRFEN